MKRVRYGIYRELNKEKYKRVYRFDTWNSRLSYWLCSVLVLVGASASAQRIILHVDGAVPSNPIGSTPDVKSVITALALEEWPNADVAATEIAVSAFERFRSAMYTTGDMAIARSEFERGYRAVAGLDGVTKAADKLLEGLWLGVHLELIEGRVDSAKQVATLALRLDSERIPPESDYSPRVRSIFRALQKSLTPLRVTGRPVGCEVMVSGVHAPARLAAGKWRMGLACDGATEPQFGRVVHWNTRQAIDVSTVAVWLERGYLAVAGAGLDTIASKLLASERIDEVVVLNRASRDMWQATRITSTEHRRSPSGLSEDALRRWIVEPPERFASESSHALHAGTWWGIGLTGTGLALLASALGTRALANDAIETSNLGVENRLSEAESLQTTTWALLGSGSAVTVIGVILAIHYGIQGPKSSRGEGVLIEPSLSGARLRF